MSMVATERVRWQAGRMRRIYTKKCEDCGASYDVTTHGGKKSRFCSGRCAGRATNPPRHGHTKPVSPTYNSWQGMKMRCSSPKTNRYENYGGSGVTVCDRWQSFDNFLKDMGVRPEGTTLGRYGDVGNYEPGNVAWMTSEEQVANRRPKPTRTSECHPDRKHYAHGQCRKCYMRDHDAARRHHNHDKIGGAAA